MALEIVNGPVDITVGGTLVDNAGGIATRKIYLQGLGLLSMGVIPATSDLGPPGTYALQLDGTGYYRSAYGWGMSGLVLIPDLRKQRGIAVCDGSSYTDFDPVVAAPAATPWLVPASGTTIASCVLTDRLLRVTGNQVLSSGLTDGVTYVAEYTFTVNAPTGDAMVSRTNADGILCVAWGGPGQIRFYDAVNRVQVGKTLYTGMTFYAAWYIPKWNVFLVTVGKQLTVFANEVRPSALSNPVALSSVQAGVVTQIKVQLLGAQSEPCSGELVNWAITAGEGSLTSQQSTTDESGNAQVGYVCPVGSSGSVTISAEVGF